MGAPDPVQLEQSPAFIGGELTEVSLVDDNGQPVTTVVGQREIALYVMFFYLFLIPLEKILWIRHPSLGIGRTYLRRGRCAREKGALVYMK